MPDYFFDTSLLVAYLSREDTRSVEIIGDVVRGNVTATISAMTVGELWAATPFIVAARHAELLAVIDSLNVQSIDRKIAERAGELRRGFDLRMPDAMIAACAEQAGGRFISKDFHYNRLLRAGILIGEIFT